MRHFTQDTGTGRKFVVVEVRGAELRVMQGKSDGTTRRTVKALKNEVEARLASQRMANELLARGFLEQVSDSSIVVPGQPSRAARSPMLVAQGVKPTRRRAKPTEVLNLDTLVEAADGAAPKPKKPEKARAGKPGRTAPADDSLDKRVIAGVVALGLALVAGVGYLTKVVERIRFRDQPAAVALLKAPEAPKDLGEAPAAHNAGVDPLATGVDFLAPDGAFRLRRPVNWAVESGSRPDNTYSWARFTQDSAKIQIAADIAGSLLLGSNQNPHEPGSDLVPVDAAHELSAKKAAEDYTDYQESAPALFLGSPLGEGRVATFTAAGSGLFGGRVQGIRVTLLTSERRITVLCEAPASQFARYKPTFLAIARSLAR